MLAVLAITALVAATPVATADSSGVRVVRQQARWDGLAPVDDLTSERAELFVISGEVRNDGPLPLAEVRLAYELLADGVVVASEHGYNRRAEALRDPEVESGAVSRASLAIPPLPPGDTDLFRMVFLRGAVPRFDDWRVRIEAANPVTPATPAR